jgi:hypothetical protein
MKGRLKKSRFFIAGHEIGHSVDFRHNLVDSSSIMAPRIRSYTDPQNQFMSTDLDSFLVKPRQ